MRLLLVVNQPVHPPPGKIREVVGPSTTIWKAPAASIRCHHSTWYGYHYHGYFDVRRFYWTVFRSKPIELAFVVSMSSAYVIVELLHLDERDTKKLKYRNFAQTLLFDSDLTGMPPKKFSIVNQEITKLLRRFDVPEPAIRKFVKQSTVHLRSALRDKAKKLVARPAPLSRWPIDRLLNENAADYVNRVYGEHIKHGLNQAGLRKLDAPALEALRNYCRNQKARPRRPHISKILPPSKKNPDHVVAKYGKLTYANSVGAYEKNPTPRNLERKRAFTALDTRKSRARHRDPT